MFLLIDTFYFTGTSYGSKRGQHSYKHTKNAPPREPPWVTITQGSLPGVD